MSPVLLGPPSYASLMKAREERIKELDVEVPETAGSSSVEASEISIDESNFEESQLDPNLDSRLSIKGVRLEDFSSFEQLMRVDKVSSSCFHRVPFKVPAGKLNFFPVPWPTFNQRVKNIFCKTKNVYYKLEGLFFLWTPLLTREKTSITLAVTDSRGFDGKHDVVNSVRFSSENVTMSGLSVGNCIHQDDLDDMKLSVSLNSPVARRGKTYASLEVCFYITVTNRPTLESNSVIEPIVVPPGVKNLMKDYNRTANFLKASNAKLLEQARRSDAEEELERRLSTFEISSQVP